MLKERIPMKKYILMIIFSSIPYIYGMENSKENQKIEIAKKELAECYQTILNTVLNKLPKQEMPVENKPKSVDLKKTLEFIKNNQPGYDHITFK